MFIKSTSFASDVTRQIITNVLNETKKADIPSGNEDGDGQRSMNASQPCLVSAGHNAAKQTL